MFDESIQKWFNNMSSSDYEDDEDGYYNEDDYYQQSDDEEYMNLYMENCLEKQKKNIEFFEIECITLSEAKSYFQSIIESVCSAIQVIKFTSHTL